MDTHLNRHFELRPHKCPHTFGKKEPEGPPERVTEPCDFNTPDPSHLSKHRKRKHDYSSKALEAPKEKKRRGSVSAPASCASTSSFEETPALSDASSFLSSSGPDTPASSDWALEASPLLAVRNLAPMQNTPPSVPNAAVEETFALQAPVYHATEPTFSPAHAPLHTPLHYSDPEVVPTHNLACVYQQTQQLEQQALLFQPYVQQASACFPSTSVLSSNVAATTSLPQYPEVPVISASLTTSHGQPVRKRQSMHGVRYVPYCVPSAPYMHSTVGYPMPVADHTACLDPAYNTLPTLKFIPPTPNIVPTSNLRPIHEPFVDSHFDANANASHDTSRNTACNTYFYFDASAMSNYATVPPKTSSNINFSFNTSVAFNATPASHPHFNAHPNPGIEAGVVLGPVASGEAWSAGPLPETNCAPGLATTAAEVAPQYWHCSEYPTMGGASAQWPAPQDVLFANAPAEGRHVAQQRPCEGWPELEALGLPLGLPDDGLPYQGGLGLFR